MVSENARDDFSLLMDAAIRLLPLLDRSLLRLRFSQGVPGLSPLEYRILDHVCQHQPIRIGRLGEMVGLSFPNASRYVKDLVAKEFLSSGPSLDDRRSRSVMLTEPGAFILSSVERSIRAEAKSAFDSLSPKEAKALITACDKLGAALEPLIDSLERKS